MSEERQRDEVTGIETTGHDWDGITELDQPLPRWWLHIFYACIAGAIVFWILYPAWPVWLGEWTYSKGLAGSTPREEVAVDLADAAAARAPLLDRIAAADFGDLRRDPDLLTMALGAGAAAFGDNCAPCHGAGAQGFVGYPNLNDDVWLWGGRVEEIATTIRHGIRDAADPETRFNMMPAHLDDGLLSREEILDVVEHVMAISGREHDGAAARRGAEVFATMCVACHSEDGTGATGLGAPNLTDAIWLYGGDREAIYRSIAKGRAGVMPAWSGRLDEATIRSLALHVHSLGGGVPE